MTLKETLPPRMSLADQVRDRLLDAILHGEIGTGEAIKEARIAQQLGISRGPLREALNQLEGRHLVERIPGIGVRVASLSDEDLIHLFEIRAVLEGLACRRAAQNLTDEEIDGLEAVVERHLNQGPPQDPARAGPYYSDDDFHLAIVRASKSPRLIKLLTEDYYYILQLYRIQARRRRGGARSHQAWYEHKEVVDALRARDEDRAEAAMRAHIERALDFLKSLQPKELPAEAGDDS